ncbi:uncharacterized protein LOC131672589 [Phymastichus coffea]|uniref:uncharacterized protein LOC131672589 n=1 Tax=Phymastichus coffea TaxID=108790 RepID=UPI00273A815C|nr:uncharacterized protein LOC131672589 [Phymastichus coffea]
MNYHDVIITGDLNANLLSDTLHYAAVLQDHIDLLGLKVVSRLPTCHRFQEDRSSHTLLDLFLVKHTTDIHSFSKTEAPFIDCHDLIELVIYATVPPDGDKLILSRNLRAIDLARLNSLVAGCLASTCLSAAPSNLVSSEISQVSIDAFERSLSSSVLYAFDTLAPLRTLKLSEKAKPWVSADIRILMRARNAAFKRAKISPCLGNIQRYRDLRNRVSNNLDTAKNTYLSARLATATDPKAKWRELRSIGIAQKQTPSPLLFFSSQSLNKHFARVVNLLPPIDASTLETILSTPRTRQFDFPQFALHPVTAKDVHDALSAANSKSKGEDGISLRMFSMVADSFAQYYAALFNQSITSSLYPSLWKRTQIVPVSKVKSPSSLSDTRPIAKLCEPSKIFERLVHRQLSGYVESHRLLDARQAGFRKGHSTETALLGLLDDVRHATEKRQVSILILFDFSKAFDRISHSRLIRKLRNLNVSDKALRWFFNYLADRIQAVVDGGGTVSEWLRAATGVPQGSVLGPLLFAVYINDLPSVLIFANYMIYADDTQVYLHCSPHEIERGLAQIQQDAQAVADWAAENDLNLNLAKTKAMILGSELFISSLDFTILPHITINSTFISFVAAAKSLGVTLSPTFQWKGYTTEIVKKVYGSLSSLKFYRKSMSLSLRKSLVEALVFPLLNFSSTVLMDLDKTRTHDLQVAQNACVRFVTGFIPFIPTSDVTTHVTYHRLRLHWLTLSSSRHLALARLLYKVVCNNGPTYLTPHIANLNHVTCSRRSLHNIPAAFQLRAPRTEAWKRSLAIRGMDLLNQLAVTDFDLDRLAEFKRWMSELLFLLELDEFTQSATHENMCNMNALTLLPQVQRPYNVSAFAPNPSYLLVPGRYLQYNLLPHQPQPTLASKL